MTEKTLLNIKLITKQEQYSVPDNPIAVDGKITCVELNSILKQLLIECSTDVGDVDFDFLTGDQFIRTSLSEHIASRNISAENIVDIEYVERLPAPEPESCILHDDWVADVHVSDNWILTGCYDSTVHLWSHKGAHKLTIPGHSMPVKGVSFISADANSASFVSASQDQTAMIWKWDKASNEVECVCICRGHGRGIECVGVNTSRTKFATGAWDSMLKIWSTSLEDGDFGEIENGEKDAKRLKSTGKHTRTPDITLKGHREAVSGLSWQNSSELVTASWDHTLRVWDISAGASVSQISGNKSFFDVDWSKICSLVITACADRHVRLYDPRSQEGGICKMQFTSHKAWATSVSWSPVNGSLFVSGSNDGLLKLWDTRSPNVPLFDMAGEEEAILCCDWTLPQMVLSGGKDNSLRIYNTEHIN